jgi:2-oxoglutarate ferredoxin oxidoreductase subunit alpha
MDYNSATRGGGGGGYRNIVLAPWSVQELHDHVQLAFYLADKYRNPTVVLSDAILGQMAEPLEVKALDLGPLPPKDWAVKGMARHADGQRRGLTAGQGFFPTPQYPTYLDFMSAFDRKLKAMRASEVRYEAHYEEDARLILVAFGSMARVALEATQMARERGMRVGLVRPISLWPFPYEAIRKLSSSAKFLVVEDNLGQMLEDVEMAVGEVHFLGMLARHEPREQGMVFPDKVLEKIEEVY